MKMTFDHARRIIRDPSQPLSALTEAAAAISASPEADESDIDQCLRLGGLPAELAKTRPPAGPLVVILEDDARRIDLMTRQLRRLLPGCRTKFFFDSNEMLPWLSEHQAEIDLLSLDHDLNDHVHPDGSSQPCGSGRDIASLLASLQPTCPVIIHSSNETAALGMNELLSSAGWPVRRVYPHDDLSWIASDWSDEIRRLHNDGWLSVKPSGGAHDQPIHSRS
jgi:CheY-like chemotaxis protein